MQFLELPIIISYGLTYHKGISKSMSFADGNTKCLFFLNCLSYNDFLGEGKATRKLA